MSSAAVPSNQVRISGPSRGTSSGKSFQIDSDDSEHPPDIVSPLGQTDLNIKSVQLQMKAQMAIEKASNFSPETTRNFGTYLHPGQIPGSTHQASRRLLKNIESPAFEIQPPIQSAAIPLNRKSAVTSIAANSHHRKYFTSQSSRRASSESSNSGSESSFSQPSDEVQFDMHDIEDLKEGQVDSYLLDLFESKEEKRSAQKEALERHAKMFGFIKIPPVLIPARKIQVLKEKSEQNTLKLQALEQEIYKLEALIDQISELDPDHVQQQTLAELQSALQTLVIQKMRVEKGLAMSKQFEQDHTLCDVLYAQMINGKTGNSRDSYRQRVLPPQPKQTDITWMTFSPLNGFYLVWRWTVASGCLASTIVYPYFIMNGFPESVVGLSILEALFVVDIIASFFKRGVGESGQVKQESLETTASNYLGGEFKLDLLILSPIGYFFSLVDHRLRIFWIIKTLRIAKFNVLISNKALQPLVNAFIERKQAASLSGEESREDKLHDHIFQAQKIHLRNSIKIIRLVFLMLFIAFFLGICWTIFSEIVAEIKDDHDDTFFHYWGFPETANARRVLLSSYFALTTLSTVGFGDLYPVSTSEHLVGAFFLLYGVAIFSYTMGELLYMIKKVKNLGGSFEEEDQLDKFFLLMRKFNHGMPLHPAVVDRISRFMIVKWESDKNQFLSEEEGEQLFSQLPRHSQRQIFTEFVFEDFLFKFRRFFRFRAFPEESRKENQHLKKLRMLLNSIGKAKALMRKSPSIHSEGADILSARRLSSRLSQSRKKKEKKTLLRRKEIEFPFLTFENDLYSEFMVALMRTLEVRAYDPQEIIIRELDESSEVLFVTEGRYNVGYELDHKVSYKREFGQSTHIGGFNACFGSRHLFNYKAGKTGIQGYAIRRQMWLSILKEFWEFERVIKQKCFHYYFSQIYYPLQQERQEGLEWLKIKKGFLNREQATVDLSIKTFWAEIQSQAETQLENSRLSSQINWLTSRIENKLNKVFTLAASLFSHCERLQRIFRDKLSRSHSCSREYEEFLKQLSELVFVEDDSLDSRINLAVLSAQLRKITMTAAKLQKQQAIEKQNELEEFEPIAEQELEEEEDAVVEAQSETRRSLQFELEPCQPIAQNEVLEVQIFPDQAPRALTRQQEKEVVVIDLFKIESQAKPSSPLPPPAPETPSELLDQTFDNLLPQSRLQSPPTSERASQRPLESRQGGRRRPQQAGPTRITQGMFYPGGQ